MMYSILHCCQSTYRCVLVSHQILLNVTHDGSVVFAGCEFSL